MAVRSVDDMGPAFASGLITGLSLIVAIGAQNAFVLRQGLRREHVGMVVAICALSDGVLILAGVLFLGALLPAIPWLSLAMRWIGAAFLAGYGALRFRAAWRGGDRLVASDQSAPSAWRVAATCLALTWLNPHVYLDTVVLLGSISARYTPHERYFGAGAMTASTLFFAALGYGAAYLAPVFASPRAWIALDILIGATMWTLSVFLVLG